MSEGENTNENKFDSNHGLEDDFRRYYTKLRDVHSHPYKHISSSRKRGRSVEYRIDQEERKKELENNARELDIGLKKNTLVVLFIFLAIETILVFTIAYFQGFKFFDFMLEEWSFRTLLIATILQITAMLTIAVQHLFPKRE